MPFKDIVRKREYQEDYGKIYYAKHKDRLLKRRRRDKLKTLYGITEEDFSIMQENQQGLCLGCNQAKSLCVDHDHETGKVRGLLCRQCNSVIGLAKEDINILRNLVSYLETGSCHEST